MNNDTPRDDLITKARQVAAELSDWAADLDEMARAAGRFHKRKYRHEARVLAKAADLLDQLIERAEKAEAQLAQVIQERDDARLMLSTSTSPARLRRVEAEAASLREALETAGDVLHEHGEECRCALCDIVFAALTPTQQEEPNE